MPSLRGLPTNKLSTIIKKGESNANQGKGKQFLSKGSVEYLANHKHKVLEKSV